MTAPFTLVSTCGASMFTNGADEPTRRWLNGITNKRALSASEQQQLDELVALRGQRLRDSDPMGRRRQSAELNGIAAVLERAAIGRAHHLVIHTETAIGQAAAALVIEHLPHGHTHALMTAGGLRIDDPASFREALAELTKHLEDCFEASPGPRWFNLTGGFKAINAYLQTLGSLFGARCAFLFEASDALMEIPQLPVRLENIDTVRRHLDVIRRMAAHYRVRREDAHGVPDALTMIVGDDARLSIWGDAVWARHRKTLLQERLHAPLSPKLVIQPAVHDEFRRLEQDRKVQVHEALDALSAHLDLQQPMLASNRLKPLRGNLAAPSTHEMYLWSDGNASRLFGHFEGDRFIADSIGRHL